jgi:hypothetical protein
MTYTKRAMVVVSLFLSGAMVALGQKVSVESQERAEQAQVALTIMKAAVAESCAAG